MQSTIHSRRYLRSLYARNDNYVSRIYIQDHLYLSFLIGNNTYIRSLLYLSTVSVSTRPWYLHGHINHGLATPFLSNRVTLNALKTRDFIRDLIIWQSYELGPLHQRSDS